MPAPTTISEFLDLVQKSGVVDEKKLDTYVEKLRAWAETWHPAVRDGFQGAGSAQLDLPGTARKP